MDNNTILFLGVILFAVIGGFITRKLYQVEAALRKLQENQKVINELETKLETSHVKVPVTMLSYMIRQLANSMPTNTTVDAVADLMDDISTKE